MNKTLLYLFVLNFGLLFAQSPGGVSGCEIWSKVNKTTPTSSSFQYKDYSANNKTVTTGMGTVLTNSLFNYNYSFLYDNTDYVSYLSKLESLKEATIFIVNLPTLPSDPSIKYGLINSDWNVVVPSGSTNQQSFEFSSATFEKQAITISYPSTTSLRPNGRINTLLWYNFNSKKITNSFGSNGESSIFIGKSFTSAANFVGQIPEFIVYRKALNDKEKWRVESYLALKYGITLQPEVNYYTSKNEIFWHKENNAIFKNRIFGIGRDSNSTLYQKQSSSIHDPSVSKQMIFWTGSFQADNYLNTAYIEDQNFITIGDNNASELPNTIVGSGIKKLDRTWLTEKFGPTAHNQSTNLKYKPNPAITLLPNEAFWLLIANNTTNTALSDFDNPNMDFYPVSTFDSDGYAVYNNLNWASESTLYNQFTFGVGPRMLIIPSVETMACNDTQGIVNITIKGGQPIFTINVHGTDNLYNLQLNQPGFNLSLALNSGNYQVTVTDATGYTQSTDFEISPTPGIAIDLGPDQYLLTGDTLILDGSAMVTSTSATYEWFENGNLILNTSDITIMQEGEYECVITDTNTGCSVSDSIIITSAQPIVNGSFSSTYPNPTNAGDTFYVVISLDEVSNIGISIFDATGKILIVDNLEGSLNYKKPYKINTPGIYFAKIESSGFSTTHKIIIN